MKKQKQIEQNSTLINKIDRDQIRKRLVWAIKELGFVDAEFLKESGLKKSTFYTLIKKGRKPNSDTLNKLEKMGINKSWLLDGDGVAFNISKEERAWNRIDRILPDIDLKKEPIIKEDVGHEQRAASGELAKSLEHLIRKIGSLPMRSQNKDSVVVFEREQAIEAIIRSLHHLNVGELQRIVDRATGILEERRRAEQERPAK